MDELAKIAREVATAYQRRNSAEGRPAWAIDNYMSGFVGDVGDLSKLIMAKSGYRDSENIDERLGHELADCLWSILIIADKLGLDIESAYRRNMGLLLRRMSSEGTS